MAPPMSASAFLRALKAEGLTVVEVGDWRDHNRNHKGPWGPVHGVMIHHTVTKGSAKTVELCRKGYSGLPGPLCHGVITKDGRVHLVGYGRANHAGLGDDDVLRAVIAEKRLPPDNEANTDGNRHFYGIEIVNRGDGKDTYPWAQYVQAVKWATALCRAHGWNERSVIGHKEWQPGKIDPYGPVIGPDGRKFDFTMSRFRADVKQALSLPAGTWGKETKVALTKKDIHDIWYADEIPAQPEPYNNSDWAEGNKTWTVKYTLYTTVRAGRETLARVKGLETELAAVKAKLDELSVGGVDLDAMAAKVADELYKRLQS